MEPVAGTARIDITPTHPVMLAGFGQRTSRSTTVNDPIHAKAMYLANGTQRLLLVTVDLLCVPGPLGAAVTAALANRSELSADEICICASHTHSAPVPFDPDRESPEGRYGSFLERALVEVGSEAIAAARPSRIRTGVGSIDFLLNRRTRGNPNTVDGRVPVVVIDDVVSGLPSAVLFGVGCHPVTMGWDNSAVSADFPGAAQRIIEERLGVANALFFNTTEGNVVPVTSPNRDALDPRGYCGGSFDDSTAIGARLADAVVRVARLAEAQQAFEVRSARRDVSIDANYAGLDADAAGELLGRSEATLAEFLGSGFAAAVPPARLWSAASAVVVQRDLPEDEMRRLMVACCNYLVVLGRAGRTGPTKPVAVAVCPP